MTSQAGDFDRMAVSYPISESEPFLRAFIGSSVLLLAVRAAEPLFFGEGYYATLAAHPFWLIVLLAAVQSGLFAGVATAGMAALMMDWPPRPVGVDITAHYVDLAVEPVLWTLTALVVGAFRQVQIREAAGLRRENARLSQVNEEISAEVLRMDAALARLELALATQPEAETVPGAGVAALRALGESADDDSLAKHFREAAEHCAAHPTALYLDQGDGTLAPADGEGAPAFQWLDGGTLTAEAAFDDDAGHLVPADTLVPDGHGFLACCGFGRQPDASRTGLVVAYAPDEAGARADLDAVVLLARQIDAALARQKSATVRWPVDLSSFERNRQAIRVAR